MVLAVGLPLIPGALVVIVWEAYVRIQNALLLPKFGDVVGGILTLLRDQEMWQALWISNQALIVGLAATLIIGIPLGLAMGRLHRLELLADGWLNILVVTPMAMIIPLLIIAFGFSLVSRSIVVLFFALPMVAINCRAGVREVDPGLVEMARTFGAGEIAIWRKVLLPGASPAIWAGIRVGIGRAITGMVLVELLLVAVGVGQLLQEYRGAMEVGNLYALVTLIVIESLILISVARRVERRLLPWAGEATGGGR